MDSGSPKLFQPIKIGNVLLQHRVVLPPLTRCRATRLGHVPVNPMVKIHYEQRSSVPGTLLITEATFIAAKAGGLLNLPGIWSDAQIKAWKEVTDAVHANGSYIFMQIWALGRAAKIKDLQEEDPSFEYVAPSPIPPSHRSGVPREMTVREIQEYVELFSQAAGNAIAAGFDGVEIHNANGYLLDQFVKEVSNQRTDEYGGSIKNRSKFTLEVVRAVVEAIGAERTGIRLSPWGVFQDMKIEDPIPQFSYLVHALKELFPNLAFLHIVEPLASGPDYADKSNDFIRDIWLPRALISTGEYTRETGIGMAEKTGELIGFGRPFIANPDLPFRLQRNLPLNVPNEKTFYTPGHERDAEVGYIDYAFFDEARSNETKQSN